MATSIIANENYLWYKPGDSFSGELGVFGYITTSGTDAVIIFSPPKLLGRINDYTINSLYLYVRGRKSGSSTGSYVGSNGFQPLNDSATTLHTKAIVNGSGALELVFRKSAGWGLLNNTLLLGSIVISITFS